MCFGFAVNFIPAITLQAQDTLYNFNFQSPLPAGITSTGTLNPTKAADGVCSKGMVQINSGQYLQVELSSCSYLSVNMKSTGSARTIRISVKKEDEAVYTQLQPALTVHLAQAFVLTNIFPALISQSAITVRIEAPSAGTNNTQIHDLLAVSSAAPIPGAEIIDFRLPGQIGNTVITSADSTVKIKMPTGSMLTNLIPGSVLLSPDATITPGAGVARDFSVPVSYTVTSKASTTKIWTINTEDGGLPRYKVQVLVTGLGKVDVSPAGADYPSGTNITLTATPLLGSAFSHWELDASGTNSSVNITMNQNKLVRAVFTNPIAIDFEKVVGFASINGDGFTGPVTGGQGSPDTLFINGPADFNKLCEALYYRGRVYKNNVPEGGMKKAPLVILLREGVYDGSQTLSANGAKVYAGSIKMLDIPEQGDLTFIGDPKVTFKLGLNVKKSWNILIRNISFYDYYDDGINIGYPETHHIWIDHCTFGHPTTLPSDSEHPDGGADVKDGASYVTISWCHFRNSWKTSLLGHSDNNGATDAGRLKVTYYANYYENINSRGPRVRFAEAHVLNNLYNNAGLGKTGNLGYGIAASNNSKVYVENNFFLDTRWPMLADRSAADFAAVYGPNLESPTGNKPCFCLTPVGNEYDDPGLTATLTGKVSTAMLNPGNMSIKFDSLTGPECTFNPSGYYDYSANLMTPQTVKVVVPLFAGADKVTFGNGGILPLRLLNFDAGNAGKAVELFWQTANEQDLSHFDIERSRDAIRFEKFASLKAGDFSAGNLYKATDHHPFAGISFYRLKPVDKNGDFTFSKNVRIIRGSFNEEVKLFPNPSHDKLLIDLPDGFGGGTIRIISLTGQVLKQLVVKDGTQQVLLDVQQLGAGNYIIHFTGKDRHASLPFTRQ
jgi:pectate lyase